MGRIKRIKSTIKSNGIIIFIVKVFKKIAYKIFAKLDALDTKMVKKRKEKMMKNKLGKYKELYELCNNSKYKYIFLFYPYTEWNLPIFQRPQQIALELAKRDDTLYLFCTANCMYDNIDIYEKIADNLYITTEFDFIYDLKLNNIVLHLYSTDIISKVDLVKDALSKNYKVLYEYIDEIHEDITASVPKEFFEKHDYLMKNEECYLVTTADKLYEDASKIRHKNYILATNGVTIEDFKVQDNIETPKRLREIKDKYKQVIGYYGALAKWFDYELLDKVAKKYSDYAIILIGLEYDKSLKKSELLENKNVYYLGKIDYKELKNYASKLDLLMIPFLINEITESTSPVKLFEYMALQKPILTTNMRECRKYESVNIAKTHEEFIEMIPEVIKLGNNKQYKQLELEEAEKNTWRQKSKDIIELLNRNM